MLVETILATNVIYQFVSIGSTFEETYFLGWKYHENQQNRKKRIGGIIAKINCRIGWRKECGQS